MEISEFVRLHELRSPNIQWFLGAGASAAAGIPTAYDVIWDLKRGIYCAESRISVATCADLGDPTLQSRIQRYFDSAGGYPPQDDDDEYAFYFERAYQSEQDRQRYIARLVSTGTPSYGHHVLAALLAADKIRVVWTTNFDRVIEDAVLPLLRSSGELVVAELETSSRALQALNESRWPLVGKLHGDFQSRRLKNVSSELQFQDEELRNALMESCRRSGLAVAGYSGRDRSVMEALKQATEDRHAFPSGFFWFHRPGTTPLPRVTQLIESARNAGIDAHLVEVGTFDELFGDVVRSVPDLPAEITSTLDSGRQRLSDARILAPGRIWPLLRTNALLLETVPTVCRRVECQIGGTSEVRRAIEDGGADMVAGRTQHGVLAFGRDSEVRRVFEPYGITDFGIHAIESRRLFYDSTEMGLLYETLCRAIGRDRPLLVERRRRSYLARVDIDQLSDPVFARLKAACGNLAGTIPDCSLHWCEALRLRIEYRLGRMWLLLSPSIWTERTEEPAVREIALEFTRARMAARFNRTWNSMLDGWIDALVGAGSESARLTAFGIGDGLDAVFVVQRRSAFSHRFVGGE